MCVGQVLTAHCGLFSLLTVFYLKTVLAAWDCSATAADGFFYLDAQPSIRCDRDWIDPVTGVREYNAILIQSSCGMAVYCIALYNILSGIFGFRLCSCGPCKHKQNKLDSEVSVDRGGSTMTSVRCLGGCIVLDMEKGRQRFAFFASKSRNRWYWWELVILMRKSRETRFSPFLDLKNLTGTCMVQAKCCSLWSQCSTQRTWSVDGG